ncbi:CKLF6 protein, partial [Psilopogon haemacephalus]|nr:CKLF6 protein [Psilopogon haemacephalus]
MEGQAVYNQTTEPQPKPLRRPLGCTLRRLRGWRLPTKALQAILSLLAVICEEVVEDCGGLYTFPFVSSTAFLLSLLILCVYCTDVYGALGEDKVQRV